MRDLNRDVKLKRSYSQLGMSLLEVMLVLAIGASLVMMSIRQYSYYNFEKNVASLQHDMEELFNAAALFYRANCASTLNTTTTPYTVLISTLISGGYLASNWSANPVNPLINTTGTNGGYAIQFNLASTGNVNVVCSTANCNSSFPTYTQLSSNLQSLVWNIQISVLTNNLSTTLMQIVSRGLGASCFTNMATSTAAYACSSNPTAPYTMIALTRLPSFAIPHALTPYWVTMPVLTQFNLQYTHDQDYELNSGTYSDNGLGNTQGNYVCGS